MVGILSDYCVDNAQKGLRMENDHIGHIKRASSTKKCQTTPKNLVLYNIFLQQRKKFAFAPNKGRLRQTKIFTKYKCLTDNFSFLC